MSSDSDEIAAPGPGDALVPLQSLPPPPRRAPRPVQTAGSYVLVVLIAVTGTVGMWTNCGDLGTADADVLNLCPDGHAVGIALSRWTLMTAQEAAAAIPAPLKQLERQCSRSNGLNFLAYPLHAMAKLDHPLDVSSLTPLQLMNAIGACRVKNWNFASKAYDASIQSTDLVSRWQT